MDAPETIVVNGPAGPLRINKADYDDAKHGQKPSNLYLTEKDGKWFVINEGGKIVNNKRGYASKDKAKEAMK